MKASLYLKSLMGKAQQITIEADVIQFTADKKAIQIIYKDGKTEYYNFEFVERLVYEVPEDDVKK